MRFASLRRVAWLPTWAQMAHPDTQLATLTLLVSFGILLTVKFRGLP